MKKRNRNLSSKSRAMLAVALTVAMVYAWQMWAESGKSSSRTTHNLPSAESLMTVKMPDGTPDQTVKYTGFTLSFNPRAHVPNWVAWELTADEAQGPVSRSGKFYCDDSVEGCAEPYDYSYSGYDRGHMCPAGDLRWSKEAMHNSFTMTNICPQVKSLNTGVWKRLEEKCRTWAKADSAIIIISGSVLSDNPRETIGDTRVVVPDSFFKVIISPFANPPRGIAFVMKNGYVEGGMQKAATTIDEVERITGFDFFSALPDSIENIVETQCDFPKWSTLK